jgi:hypothetical protein
VDVQFVELTRPLEAALCCQVHFVSVRALLQRVKLHEFVNATLMINGA